MSNFSHETDYPWQSNGSYPEELRKKYRYREFRSDRHVKFGILELDVGAVYPHHSHPAVEVYYVIEGECRWAIGEETKDLGPGAVMNHPPGAIHAFENIGDITLRLYWTWWADDRNPNVLDIPARLC